MARTRRGDGGDRPARARARARTVAIRRLIGLGATAACLALVLIGCPGVWIVEEPDRVALASDGLTFPHRLHVEDMGLYCEDCHVDAGPAEEETCGMCHEPIGPEGPVVEDCSMCHTRDDMEVVDRLPEGYDDVIFDHDAHLEVLSGGEEEASGEGPGAVCATCHGDVAASETTGRYDIPSMTECMECHEQEQAPNDCITCHEVERTERPPDTHASAAWMRTHGEEARTGLDRPEEFAASCFYCHVDLDCEQCHSNTEPRDHTTAFVRRTHGLAASMDRTRCMTCHTVDTCERCHLTQEPTSHAGAFGSPRNRHCITCHEPLDSTQCSVCHEAAFSHDLAAPQPPDHVPGRDCRQCHGLGAPLPHVDNGALCESCHF